MEVEDDVFFADLSKRIALLIMDDDDEDNAEDSPMHYPSSVSIQSFSRPMTTPSGFAYEPVTCRRECKGTGVFIPRSSTAPRRKNKPGRFASFNTNKSNRQPDKLRGVSHVTSNLNLSCNYFNSNKSVKEYK